jgi:hypothetical protein
MEKVSLPGCRCPMPPGGGAVEQSRQRIAGPNPPSPPLPDLVGPRRLRVPHGRDGGDGATGGKVIGIEKHPELAAQSVSNVRA